MRAALVTEDEKAIELILTVSALCVDEASMSLVIGEVAAHLGSADLVGDPLQYPDFSAWQHELNGSDDDEARAARAFWARARRPSPRRVLPFTGSGGEAAAAVEVAIEIDDALAEALAEQARRYGTSSAAFVQAAWHAVLGRFSGEETTAVAFVSGDRRHPDLEGAVGCVRPPRADPGARRRQSLVRRGLG